MAMEPYRGSYVTGCFAWIPPSAEELQEIYQAIKAGKSYQEYKAEWQRKHPDKVPEQLACQLYLLPPHAEKKLLTSGK
jgi:hypothetical protein